MLFRTRVRLYARDVAAEMPSRWKRFGEGACCSHAGLHGAERMLHRIAAQGHGLWVCEATRLCERSSRVAAPTWSRPLQNLQTTGLGHVDPAVLALPFIERRTADPVLAANIPGLRSGFVLTQIAMIRSSLNLDCFIAVSLKVTDSTHF